MAFRALERRSRIHSASKASIIPKKGLNRLRADIEDIRHAAVHRQLQDHRRLLRQLHSARVFATVWLGDPQCGMEIEQCQMRINRLFSGWKHAPAVSKAIWLRAWFVTRCLKIDVPNSSCSRRQEGSWKRPITIVLGKWTTSFKRAFRHCIRRRGQGMHGMGTTHHLEYSEAGSENARYKFCISCCSYANTNQSRKAEAEEEGERALPEP
ncbi:hypothetical protein AnigIFM63604_003492 [Aspergillus niger]|uniref:Uncharacterized protein n=1 Tax=Aspergillus niger TaxID=5061 RepID=A0A9W6EF86_ASPNG|nr:hypothetical protein AnigIFM63604_003492 [Aspergillus niger]